MANCNGPCDSRFKTLLIDGCQLFLYEDPVAVLGDTPDGYIDLSSGMMIALRNGKGYMLKDQLGNTHTFTDTDLAAYGVTVAAINTAIGGCIGASAAATSDFLSLTDTPLVYTGAAGQNVVVNALETALEFGFPSALSDVDADTSIETSEGTGANGGDELIFTVDGVQVGSVEILAGGTTKWNFDGIVDPIVFGYTPLTTVQRDALTGVEGYTIYNADTDTIQYYDGATWQNIGTSVDLNTTISDETGGNGTGVVVPASAPATPDIGDMHIEVYDDVTLYFTATAADWLTPAVVEISRDTTTINATDSDSGFNLVTNNAGVLADVNQDALKVNVLSSAPVDGTTTAYFAGQLFWDNVNKKLYESTAKSTDPDAAGTGSTFVEVVLGVPANDRLFADDTTVAPATAGEPTIAEIATFAGTNYDRLVVYNGTDVDSGVYTYVFHIDASGNVTLVQEPETVGYLSYTNIGVSPVIDYSIYNRFQLQAGTAGSPADIVIPEAVGAFPTGGGSIYMQLINDDVVSRDFVFNTKYKKDGADLGTVTIAAGEYAYIKFEHDEVAVLSDTFNVAWDTFNADDSIYNADGTLSSTRFVTMSGFDLILDGAGPGTTFTDYGMNYAAGWDSYNKNHIFATGVSDGPDMATSRIFTYTTTDASTGDVNITTPTNLTASSNYVTINLSNTDTIARNFIFSSEYRVTGDTADLGTIAVQAGEGRVIHLKYVDSAPVKWVVAYDTGATGGTNIGNSDLQLNGVDRTFDLNGQEFFIEDSTTNRFVYINDGTLEAESLTISSDNAVDDSPLVPNPRVNNNVTRVVTNASVGDYIVSAPTGGIFSLGNLYTFIFVNADAIDRNIVFDTEYKDNNGTDLGTVVVPAGEQIEYQLMKIDSNIYRRIDFDGEAPDQLATLIDSSAGASIETLDPATGSGKVIFFANQNVTSNSATLVPQAGESLNGVTDGTFYFSNYADGTQFVATDVGTGEWVIAVEGASTNTTLEYIRFGYDMTASGGLNTTEADEPILEGIASTGVTYLDENSNLDLATGAYTAPHDMRIKVDVIVGYMNNTSTGTNAVANQRRLAYSIDGATPIVGSSAPINPEWLTSINDYLIGSGTLIVDLAAGEVLTLFWSQPEAESLVQTITFNDVTIQELPSTQAVLAGMVTPTDLGYEESVLASPIAVSGPTDLTTVTVPNDGDYEITVFGNIAIIGDDVFTKVYATLSDNTLIERTIVENNLSSTATTDGYNARLNASATVRVNGLVAGQVLKLRGESSGSGNAGENTSIAIQQLPTSTLVNPDGLVPEDLHYLSLGSDEDGTGSRVIISSATTIGTGYRVLDLKSANFDTVLDDNSLIDASGNFLTIQKAGLYELSLGTSVNSIAGDPGIYVNGTILVAGMTNDTTFTGVSVSSIVSLNVGDQVEFGNRSTDNVSSYGVFITVKQLPTSTVTALDPAFTEAKDLYSTSLYTNGGNVQVTQVGTSIGSAYFVVDMDDASFTVSDSEGLINTTDNSVTLTEVGRYKFYFSGEVDGATGHIKLYKNGVSLLSSQSDNDDSTTLVYIEENGVVGDKFEFAGTSSVPFGNPNIIVEKLPDTQYVTPGDVPVEDVEVALGSVVGGINGATLTISENWSDLAATYEYVRFYLKGNTVDLSASNTIRTADISDGAGVRVFDNGTASFLVTIGTAASNTATLNEGGTSFNSYDLYAVGVKAQKTVINTNDAVIETASHAKMQALGAVDTDPSGAFPYDAGQTETVGTGWTVDAAAGTLTATKDMGWVMVNFSGMSVNSASTQFSTYLEVGGNIVSRAGGTSNGQSRLTNTHSWAGSISTGDVIRVVLEHESSDTLYGNYNLTATQIGLKIAI